jgi:DNA-binding XRE family transcriptional regulator
MHQPHSQAHPSVSATPAHPHHPDHADWLARAVGAELRRLRRAAGMSAYELALPGWISDQTILNNESGTQNPGLKTLARHCQRLGTTLPAVLTTVMRPERQG